VKSNQTTAVLAPFSTAIDIPENRLPDSRWKAYYLMAIHESLTRVPKQQLREVGWSKAKEQVKVARREGKR